MTALAHVSMVHDGAKGFDCDHALTAEECASFVQAGYEFVVRYVARRTPHPGDLTAHEVQTILASGLGLMVVQHVSKEGWVPSASMGGEFGAEAAREAIACQIPSGVSLWCDLEGVAPHTASTPVIAFCSRWHRSVALGGFLPGLYVGWHPGLDAAQLYSLPFTHYWGAYNVDQVPSVRAFQMKQSPMLNDDRVPGITFEFDVNHTMPDKLGGRCQMLSVSQGSPI